MAKAIKKKTRRAAGARSRRGQPRAKLRPEVEEDVLRRCRRHCCMCFGLYGTFEVTEGQIAHLDRNRANSVSENLAFLCLACHKNYDTKSNRVKAFTAGEIRHYRAMLYRRLGHDRVRWQIVITAESADYDAANKAVLDAVRILREYSSDVSVNEGPLG